MSRVSATGIAHVLLFLFLALFVVTLIAHAAAVVYLDLDGASS